MNTANRVAAIPLAVVLTLTGCRGSEANSSPEAIMTTTQLQTEPVPRMRVERAGSGPPLVLVGGGLTGWASWAPHAERLADAREVARFQLISVQYGLEDEPLPQDYSLRTESRALGAALDGIGWNDPVDLVAWSYGAAVTLDFALEHPERVRTLTLIEPPALWVLPKHGRALPDVRALEALVPDVADDVGVETLERFVRTAALVPPGADPESLPQWETWMRHRRSLRNGDAVFRHDDDAARLRRFTAPVLLVTGRGTSPFLRAVHDTLAASLPNASTLELQGGHAPHIAAMDDFLGALLRFHESAADGRHAVRSPDGTPIAFWRGGVGPALLLVHGTTADHTTTWRFVRSELERHFTVYAMDRRGRGGSGDGPVYDLAREAEDVAAIVDAIGEPVSVLGHSSGALVALEAARLTAIHRLILYEGVPLRGSEMYAPGVVERLYERLAAGDVEGTLTAMYTDLVGLSPEEMEMMRGQHDAWATRLRNTPTVPRELGAEEAYVFAPERFREMRTPTMLLVGGDSPPREHTNARAVADALPDGRVVLLPGEQHVAMYTVPELFVAETVSFLLEVP